MRRLKLLGLPVSAIVVSSGASYYLLIPKDGKPPVQPSLSPPPTTPTPTLTPTPTPTPKATRRRTLGPTLGEDARISEDWLHIKNTKGNGICKVGQPLKRMIPMHTPIRHCVR